MSGVLLIIKSLEPLVRTLCDLSDSKTTVLISYEERTTGNKPLVEKKFHQVTVFNFDIGKHPKAWSTKVLYDYF